MDILVFTVRFFSPEGGKDEEVRAQGVGRTVCINTVHLMSRSWSLIPLPTKRNQNFLETWQIPDKSVTPV